MHPNPVFKTAGDERNLGFALARGFGMLAVSDPRGGPPLLSHIPFSMSEDGAALELHLVRSNPIARAVTGTCPARIAVSGPEGYISPDWYGMPDQVPTWNYVAVHVDGVLERMEDGALRGVIDRLSAVFENRLAPKTPWTLEKTDPEITEKLMRMIVPYRLTITGLDGTWKLSQNKADAARIGAADGAEETGAGELAALMRDLPV
ncbi:FMN-binding negative transcriptional regulator [Chachezhania antarctica]|uniref:FMN-binding negative transcriptional regulator n=1 Tax=Chachezhania antarctica TaxID=2340860 RepID=UPI000EB41371|nr:FMN-binding negative transcriptional regulator [Chachezhania antarctica]